MIKQKHPILDQLLLQEQPERVIARRLRGFGIAAIDDGCQAGWRVAGENGA